MKKLGKLSINPEKVIKNEELVNLRGGYDYELGSCGWSGNADYRAMCGYSQNNVEAWANLYLGSTWCCETPTTYCSKCG